MSSLRALFFDVDGVIVDTERDGHRVSFNAAFRERGLPVEWGVDLYHDLIQIAGGKERMRHHFDAIGLSHPEYLADKDRFIKALHGRKTEIYMELIESGKLPLRPGIERLMRDAARRGIFIGVCTTSDHRAASAVIRTMLPGIAVDLLLAGDAVRNKKPDPEIYRMALERSHADPRECFVIEDSHIGVLAAHRAGLHVAATVNDYTREEDVSLADFIVDCLGDPQGPLAKLLGGRIETEFRGIVDVGVLEGCLERSGGRE